MENIINFNEELNKQNLNSDTALLFKDTAGKDVAIVLTEGDTPALFDCDSGSEIAMTNTAMDDTQIFVDSNGCEIAVTVDKHGDVELFNIDEDSELKIGNAVPVVESESLTKDNGNSLSVGTVSTKEDTLLTKYDDKTDGNMIATGNTSHKADDTLIHKTDGVNDGNVIAIERKGDDLIFHKQGDNMISTGKTASEIGDKLTRLEDDPVFDRDWDKPLMNEDSEEEETKSTPRKKNKFLIPIIVLGLAILCYFYFKK